MFSSSPFHLAAGEGGVSIARSAVKRNDHSEFRSLGYITWEQFRKTPLFISSCLMPDTPCGSAFYINGHLNCSHLACFQAAN